MFKSGYESIRIWCSAIIYSYIYYFFYNQLNNYFGVLDFNEDETEEYLQNKILCDTNVNVVSNELKNKKRKKRRKKPKDSIIKCPEVEEIKKYLLKTIENKDAIALRMYLSMEGLNKPISKEYLEISLNEAVDETKNTVLHLAATNRLHDHI